MSNEKQESHAESSLQLDLLAWYELNKRKVFAGIGLIVVAVGVTMVVNHTRETRMSDASRDLLLLLSPGSQEAKAPDAAKLLDVAQRHAGTPASTHATLLAGRELFAAGKYAEARAQFEKVIDPNTVLGAIALYGVAASIDAEKGGADAQAAYQKVIDHPQGAPFAGRARLAKARLHESASQFKEALAAYDELGRNNDRELANEAFIRRTALLRAHPELNLPATMTNTVNVLPGAGGPVLKPVTPAPAPAPAPKP